MYFTHRFDHPESLARFKSWLDQLRIEHRQVKTQTPGTSRIALTVAPRQLDAIRLLINTVERIAPEQSPEIEERPGSAPATGRSGGPEPRGDSPRFKPGSVVIGWHPYEPAPVAGAALGDT
jgi:hypothetical protein